MKVVWSEAFLRNGEAILDTGWEQGEDTRGPQVWEVPKWGYGSQERLKKSIKLDEESGTCVVIWRKRRRKNYFKDLRLRRIRAPLKGKATERTWLSIWFCFCWMWPPSQHLIQSIKNIGLELPEQIRNEVYSSLFFLRNRLLKITKSRFLN